MCLPCVYNLAKYLVFMTIQANRGMIKVYTVSHITLLPKFNFGIMVLFLYMRRQLIPDTHTVQHWTESQVTDCIGQMITILFMGMFIVLVPFVVFSIFVLREET